MATDTTADGRDLAALDSTEPAGLIEALRTLAERLDVMADFSDYWRTAYVKNELRTLRDIATAALVAVGK